MESIRLKTRKMLRMCLCISIPVIFSSCNGGYTAWQENKSVHGIEFDKIRYGIEDNDTTTVIGYLKADTMIDQYPCAADWVHFTKDWKLKLFRLSSKAEINNFEYCENSWIRFSQDGNVICVFPENMTVQGYKCRGGGGASGISTSFYKNGRLQYFYSEGDIRIGDVLCKSNVNNNIGLYENGSLMECTLAKDTQIGDVNYKKNTRICFDEAGKVKAIL